MATAPTVYVANPETIDTAARAAGKCGKIKEDGTPCRNKAGKGTLHVGQGCCDRHGGSGGRKINHGLYAELPSSHLKELMEAAAALDDPLDLTPHLAMVQALIVDYVGRYEKFAAALIAWHESFFTGEGEPKPMKIMDIATAVGLIDKCAAIIDRIHKREDRQSVPMETFEAVINLYAERVAGEVREIIDDTNLRAELGRAINGKCAGLLDELTVVRKRR